MLARIVLSLVFTLLSCCGLTGALAQQSAGDRNAASLREKHALHVGALAYVYGYPMVDMRRQMHNETHRVSASQQVYAPVNQFYAYDYLVTPSTAGNLRGPNNDTLYFGGWFDLTKEPVIVHAPDTAGRYYTLAVTDFYAESHHVGHRTTGTLQKYFALVGPGWKGTLPPYVHVVRVPTPQVWILGRMLVVGEADFAAAHGLIKQFWASPLSEFKPNGPVRKTVPEMRAETINPMDTLDFFKHLNAWLRTHPGEADEGALMSLFDQIGIGPSQSFDLEKLDEATRRGLEQALKEGAAMVQSATQSSMKDMRNGWMFVTNLGRYDKNYLLRASVVKNGYANAAEESAYAAQLFDEKGKFLSGEKNYELRMAPHEIPPAGAFWSIVAYDLKTAQFFENPIRRYSIGDRTQGLKTNADGTISLYIQHQPPKEGTSNWLPVGAGEFYLVMRIYEPKPSVFDGSYRPALLKERN